MTPSIPSSILGALLITYLGSTTACEQGVVVYPDIDGDADGNVDDDADTDGDGDGVGGDANEDADSCVDLDGDGYGLCPNCGTFNGCANDGDDCDDTSNSINPGETEQCGNTVDENCDDSLTIGCEESARIFPGAIGFGTDSRGAYGASNDPVICIVNNPSTSNAAPTDGLRNGTPVKLGSFRACVDHTPPADTGKVILFETSGTINATTDPYFYVIDDANTTIFGQSAPSPGITLRNLTLTTHTSDILIQHLRFRMGDALEGHNPRMRDSFYVTVSAEDISNIVIDHCSISWGVDETISIYDNGTGSIRDVTVSNCIVSEGLNDSIHPEGLHSKGVLVSSSNGPGPERIALLSNIIMSSSDRTPYLQNMTDTVVANNLLYNNELFNVFMCTFTQVARVNVINNAGLAGPSSGPRPGEAIITLWSLSPNGWYNEGDGFEVYLAGNRVGENVAGVVTWNDIQTDPSDWNMVDNRNNILDTTLFKETTPSLAIDGAVYLDSAVLHDVLPTSSGARPADRDAVDARLVNEISIGGGSIKDCVEATTCANHAGGWPDLLESTHTLAIPSDPHGDSDGDGYSNLEEWMHCEACTVEGRACVGCP